mmetsp:Transcript_38692/g.98948  ORF Transcript_38692/g.98948 Transcript_38692/m.98948 type:complete len:250 (-) Transcript_38692:259-1008(-)
MVSPRCCGLASRAVLVSSPPARRLLGGGRRSPQLSRMTRGLTVLASEGYKFGDLTKRLVKDVKSGLDKVGQDLTGDGSYAFGDYSKRLLGRLREETAKVDFELLGSEARAKLASYEFGSITKSILDSNWGKDALASATETGRKLTGDDNYQVGDLTKGLIARLEGAKNRAAKIIALPDDVGELRQIVLEQQLLIQSLTSSGGVEASSVQSGQFLLPETSSSDDLKSMVVDNQEVIDIVLSSQDDEDAGK